ncbi:MAG: TonB-dependent receptor, partial [Caulobacter sp.]|nr:TonB-dependent receptor [Caulobacter sp.]
LYLANQTSYAGQTTIDPCINWGDSTNARIQANCASAGLPSDWAGYGSSALVVAGGGAGVLKAETSDASTLGVIFTPQFMDLSVAVDYFDILVNNEIDQFGAGNILYQCYNATTYGDSPFCSLFERDATTGQITTVYNSYVNVAEQRNRGVDLSVTYRHEFDAGALTLNAQFTWQLQDTTRVFGSDEDDYNGSTYNYRGPDFVGNTTLTWRTGDWTYSWMTQYIGKGSDTEIFGTDTYGSTRYASASNYDYTSGSTYYNYIYYKQYTEFQTYHSVSLRKAFGDMTVTAGLQNIFDEDPPAASAGQFRVGTSALNGYDLRGRRAFLTIQKRW